MRQSGMIKRQKIRDGVMEKAVKQTFQQYMSDMFILALNDPDVMGKDVLGYKRLVRVMDAVQKNYDRFYDALRKTDESDYCRVKMDEAMKRIIPADAFIPFEERYEWLPQISYEKK